VLSGTPLIRCSVSGDTALVLCVPHSDTLVFRIRGTADATTKTTFRLALVKMKWTLKVLATFVTFYTAALAFASIHRTSGVVSTAFVAGTLTAALFYQQIKLGVQPILFRRFRVRYWPATQNLIQVL